MEYLWIALGSALGGVGRYWLSGVIAQRFGETFPVGTLVVNTSGSFLIGLVAALSDPDGRLLINPTARHFIMAGVLGGYTTFSSFSLQTLNLLRDGEWLYAAANAVLSLVFCLLAVWLGHLLGQAISRQATHETKTGSFSQGVTDRTRGIFGISTSVGLRGFSGLSLYRTAAGNLLGVQRTKRPVLPEIFCVIREQGTIATHLCQERRRSINSFQRPIGFD